MAGKGIKEKRITLQGIRPGDMVAVRVIRPPNSEAYMFERQIQPNEAEYDIVPVHKESWEGRREN